MESTEIIDHERPTIYCKLFSALEIAVTKAHAGLRFYFRNVFDPISRSRALLAPLIRYVTELKVAIRNDYGHSLGY